MPPKRGSIETSTKSNAQAIIRYFKKKGVTSRLDQKSNGNWIVNYFISFKQMLNVSNMVTNLKQDQNVNDKDMKMDDSMDARVVDIDLKLALKQAPNIKFSYIDNKISTEKALGKLDEYKVKDLDGMDDFFQRVDPEKMSISDSDEKLNDYKRLYNGDDVIEKWWFSQTETLKDNIEIQFANSQEEFALVGINLLYNSKHATKYLQHKGYENSVLMFHGAKQKDMGSIFQTGFQMCPDKSIGKLYGIGHYFTPQALHAIRYLSMCKGYRNAKEFTLIAAFVNPGKIKEIKGVEYSGQPIGKGYDSHYAKVTDGVEWLSQLGRPIYNYKGYNGDIMEEYAIRDSTRILPRFYITLRRVEKVFIWRDKNIANQFNGMVLKELKQNAAIYGVIDTNTAITLVKKKMNKNNVYVITNGAHDGEGFVRTVRDKIGLKTDILVFCSAVDWHSKWAKKFKNIHVKCGKRNIISFIDKHS